MTTCDADGEERPDQASPDWVDDPTWGVVHRSRGEWHTVGNTPLLQVAGVFVERPGPEHPELPAEIEAP